MTKINSINRKVLFILCACLCSINGWAVDIHVGSQADWNGLTIPLDEEDITINITGDFTVDLNAEWKSKTNQRVNVVLEGNGHTITFNGDKNVSSVYGLLFTEVKKQIIIRNLNIEMNGKITSSTSGLGGIVGYNSYENNKDGKCTFENVHLRGTNDNFVAKTYAGGFVGVSEGSVKILNCSVKDLGFDVYDKSIKWCNVGTFIGSVETSENDKERNVRLSIKNSNAESCSIKGKKNLGGLVGYIATKSTVIDAVSTKNVVINVYPKITDGENIGGIVGFIIQNNGTNHSFSSLDCETEINIDNSKSKNVGGIVGNCYGAELTISDAHFNGKISSSTTSTNNTSENVGGIIGYGVASLKNVTVGSSASPLNFDVKAQNVGGLIGYSDSSVSGSRVSLESAFVFADMKRVTSGIGGLFGFSSKEIVARTSSTNDVYSTYKGIITTTKTSSNVGGIIGGCGGGLTVIGNDHSGIRVLPGSEISGGSRVGGYIGSATNNFTLENITLSDVSVHGSGTDGCVGGFVGYVSFSGKLQFNNNICESIDVKADGNTKNVGGFIGYTENDTVNMSNCDFLKSRVELTNCKIDSHVCLGGFLGSCAFGNFKDCSFGDADKSEASYITFNGFDKHVDVYGNDIGGYVGNNNSGVSFESCSFYGEIQLTKRDNGCKYVGGFVGYSKKNATFDNCRVTLLNSVSAKEYIGGFVGFAFGGSYEFNGCNIKGDASAANITLRSVSNSVGGLVGGHGSAPSGIDLENAELKVNDTSVEGVDLVGKQYVGGFIGYAQQKSQFTGTCKFLGSSIVGTDNVGGYVGYVNGKTSFGNFTNKFMFTDEDHDVTISGTSNVGGFIGCLNDVCTISNAEMPARVSIASDNIAGGLVGLIDNDAKSSNVLNAVKCVNKANVSSVATAAGGIVGKVKTDAYIYDCSNSGVVKLISESNQSTGVGGIVGLAEKMSDIKYCYNEGTVQSETSSSSGGILGYSASTAFNIYDCFNRGTIKNGGVQVGGIAGYFTGTVENCYNIGNVYNNNKNKNTQYYGIMGGKTGSILNCYSFTRYRLGDKTDIVKNSFNEHKSDYTIPKYGAIDYDTLCFRSGRLAYSLEMGYMSELAKSELIEDEVHFVQDLALGDTIPYLVFQKENCMAYPDNAAALIKTDPRQVVMSLTDVGRKYVREHIVYCGTIIRDTYDSEADTSLEDVQGLTHKTHTDYFNLADDASQTHAATGNCHTDSFVDKNFTKYGTTSNNYMKVITGVIKPNEIVTNQPGGMFKANGIWANVEFADGKITNYLSAEANEIKITDAALNSKQGKTDCIPFNLYLPMDVTVNDESRISYTRKATSSLLSIDLPFAVGSVKDSNGNDVTSEVSFGVLKSYTNENDNPTLNFEAKTIDQFDGEYAPAGAYICEYTGPAPATLVFYGKNIDGNGAKVKKTYCPDAFRPTECKLPGRDDLNASSEDFYTHYTGGSGNVSILGYTCRYIMNSANWAHYYYMSKGKFYGAASQGGIFASPFRSMIYFHDSEGPMAQDGNSAKAATLSFIHFSPEDEDVETSVYRMEDIDADHYVDVYSVNGTKVRAGVASSKALEDLPAGIYVINGIKVVK